MKSIALTIFALAVTACATTQSQERVVSEGVILPNYMCAKRGVAAASNDPVGQRMICEMEELVGTHLPRCVCRDEKQIVADREDSQQTVLDMEQHKCISNGGATCGH